MLEIHHETDRMYTRLQQPFNSTVGKAVYTTWGIEMKRIIIMAIGLLLVGTASFADNDQDSKLQESQKTAPNNTSKNYRDRHHRDTTAQDQSNAESDVDVTRNLRKAIMAKKGMSIDAQNVKIITENGVLTLKGPVDSEKEKELIGSMAKRCCGVRAFTNQLEVKGHNSQ